MGRNIIFQICHTNLNHLIIGSIEVHRWHQTNRSDVPNTKSWDKKGNIFGAFHSVGMGIRITALQSGLQSEEFCNSERVPCFGHGGKSGDIGVHDNCNASTDGIWFLGFLRGLGDRGWEFLKRLSQ
jgi:hypothetical protein